VHKAAFFRPCSDMGRREIVAPGHSGDLFFLLFGSFASEAMGGDEFCHTIETKTTFDGQVKIWENATGILASDCKNSFEKIRFFCS